jgi:hypothetical protein
VSKWDVTECLEILEESQKNLGLEEEDRRPMHDFISNIFEIVRDLCKYSPELSVGYQALKTRVISRGFSEEQLNETLDNYLSLNLLMSQNDVITLIDG